MRNTLCYSSRSGDYSKHPGYDTIAGLGLWLDGEQSIASGTQDRTVAEAKFLCAVREAVIIILARHKKE